VSKVGFVTNAFLDTHGKVFGGGAERHLYQLMRLTADTGAEPVLYQPADERSSSELDGIVVRLLPERPSAIWTAGCRQAVADGCHFVHYQNFPRPWQVASDLSATATQHGIYWDVPFEPRAREWYPIPAFARVTLPWWRRVERHSTLALMGRLHSVLATDSGFLRLVQAYRPELRHKVHVALNFSDLPDGEVNNEPMDSPGIGRLVAAREAGRTIVLVPRNLSLVRGIWWLPDIVEQVLTKTGPLVTFAVTGVNVPFYGGASRYEKALAARLNSATPDARAAIQLLGGIPHPSMVSAYRLSDIVLIPTFAHEGTPLAAIEAMALARPVVATNIGGLNDILDDRFTGMLVRPSIGDIAGAIIDLIEHPDLRKTLGFNAQIKARACLTLDSWRQQVRPFIESSGWSS